MIRLRPRELAAPLAALALVTLTLLVAVGPVLGSPAWIAALRASLVDVTLALLVASLVGVSLGFLAGSGIGERMASWAAASMTVSSSAGFRATNCTPLPRYSSWSAFSVGRYRPASGQLVFTNARTTAFGLPKSSSVRGR